MRASLFLLCVVASLLPAQEADEKPATFVRPAGKGFEKECAISLKIHRIGWNVRSDTFRGESQLSLVSRYDLNDRLTGATVTLSKGDDKSTATVEVTKDKAKVLRKGQPAQEFDVAAGVIVTSAPDWTDIWLLCRRYDRKKGGQQTFPGLWIHPTQPAQAIPFKIERTGADTIQRKGAKVTLDRYTIHIRGPSPYAAWADPEGRLVKLAPLPVKEAGGITAEEYAESVRGLGVGIK